MNDPTRLNSRGRYAFSLIIRMLGGALLTWIGWLSWTNASIELWPLWFWGIVCLLAGGVQLIATMFWFGSFLIGDFNWRRYRRLGRTPKADSLARDADLLEHGRLK